jgi:hypothetical protein
MPQLWIETWVTQYFWLVIILFLFHFYITNNVIPGIATVFKIRKTLGKDASSEDVTAVSHTASFKVNLPTPFSQTTLPTSFDGKKVLKEWVNNQN